MTNEEAAAMLERMKNYFLPTSPMLEERREITALDLAISALSKQSASSEQVDKSVIVDFVAFQREWLNSHKTLELDAVNNALVNIFLKTTGKAFIDTPGQTSENDEAIRKDDHIAEPDKMVDQFREDTKKTDDVLINLPSAQPETNCSEIPNNSNLISRQAAIDAVEESRRLNHHEDGKEACCHEYEHRHFLKILYELPSAQPEQKTGRWIKDMTDKLTRLINEFEMIMSDIREKKVDDCVCGLCEYDADHGMGGYANECPGFEKDDCFKLKDEYRKQWMSMKW